MNYGQIIFKGVIYDSTYINNRIKEIKNAVFESNLRVNEFVAIVLPRNVDLICSMLCLLEIEVPFLIIDPFLPINRISFMLENTNCSYLISNLFIPQKNLNYIDIYTHKIYGKEKSFGSDIAYLLYTSGSTGIPKAVMVKRSGLFNFINCIPEILHFNKEIIAAFTHQTFDIFMLETVMALYKGYSVVLSSLEENRNPKKLIELIKSNNISTIQMTPSRMAQLILLDDQLSFLDKVKNVLIGGEQFPKELLLKLQEKNCKIYNMYGPTETTIWSSISELTHKKNIDIGKPIQNTSMYIIENDREVKNGEIGEICISGAGLAKGYYGNEELSKRLFVFNAYLNKEIYKTGDLGYINEMGDFVCLGRIDNQIKLRGHRIELEEIDYQVQKYDGIDLAATCYFERGVNSKLICFYQGCPICDLSVKKFLEQIMPEYMVPQDFIRVESLIYTDSGKIDRKALLKSIEQNNVVGRIKLSDDVSHFIVDKIYEVTGINVISTKEMINNLNVNSLNFIEIVVKIEDEFNIEFEDDKLMFNSFSTIDELISYVKNLLGSKKIFE